MYTYCMELVLIKYHRTSLLVLHSSLVGQHLQHQCRYPVRVLAPYICMGSGHTCAAVPVATSSEQRHRQISKPKGKRNNGPINHTQTLALTNSPLPVI